MTHHLTPCIKPDPALHDDQEDLLMSYLNSDYMASSPCLNNSSASSPSPPTPKFNPVQDMQYPHPDTSPVSRYSQSSDSSITWASAPPTPDDSLFRQQQQAVASCFHPTVLANNLHFMIPSHEQMQQQQFGYMNNGLVYVPHYFPSPPQQLPQQPNSPGSSSSYSSSSESKEPRRKRGRKKRGSCDDSSDASNSCGSLTPPPPPSSQVPTAIAPAPLKHLPTILPAQHPHMNGQQQSQELISGGAPQLNKYGMSINSNSKSEIVSKKEPGSPQTTLSISNRATSTAAATTPLTNVDPQKAATIAKRQERLIKNRAAALLSRKRKREHLNALEYQCADLTNTNQALLDKVAQLEKENSELKDKLAEKETTASTAVTTERPNTDLMSMIIVCYLVFVMSFSSYVGGKGLEDFLSLAPRLDVESSTTAATASFHLESYHKECSVDKQQQAVVYKQEDDNDASPSNDSLLSSTTESNNNNKTVQRRQFQRVVL